MSMPSPSERLASRLEHLPDACRALLAALERAQLRGGGEVEITFVVGASGHVKGLVVPVRYERRSEDGGAV